MAKGTYREVTATAATLWTRKSRGQENSWTRAVPVLQAGPTSGPDLALVLLSASALQGLQPAHTDPLE